MGALEKIKKLFFGAPAQKVKKKKKPEAKKKHLKLVPKPSPQKNLSDKTDIKILQEKIAKKISQDDTQARKAAMIIQKMIQKNNK